MKNLFRYLSAFAIAGVVGLSVTNVSAEELTCEDGEKLHTDYYMFLSVDSVSYFENYIGTADGTLSRYTSGQKNNLTGTIGRNNMREGHVQILRSDGDSSDSTYPSGSDVQWTVGDYWKNYYVAMKNLEAGSLVYTEGDTSYSFHSGWLEYDQNWNLLADKTSSEGSGKDSSLVEYIGNNLANIETDTLSTEGTSLPTSTITPPVSLGQTTDTLLEWKIMRQFKNKDFKDGVTINSKLVIYSPAAYYVKYCVSDSSSTKYIRYDANVDDTSTVTNLPAEQEFTDSTNISKSEPSRDGYTFLGWSKDPAATTGDETYAPGTEYSGESITLYAVWSKNEVNPDGSFTVTYDANGGKGAPKAETGASGACIKISDTKPTLTGNNFLGWSTDPKAKEADANFAAGKEYCGTDGNITLYAVWQTQTGVSAHLIAFGTVILASVGALIVAKKKNLFRQI